MIYSASRRTDLPAFFPDYIVEKVRRSRKLEGIVFWTKDVRNFVRHLGLQNVILNYPVIIQFTLTGLAGSIWEPGVPKMREQEEAIRELHRILPAGALRWRFDPIISNNTLYERFYRVCDFFAACGVDLKEVTVSFPDLYRKVINRLRKEELALMQLSFTRKKEILRNFHESSGLLLRLCCEEELLGEKYCIAGKCIDAELFEKCYGVKIRKIVKDTHQRPGCGCDLSTDIGSYDLHCRHNCLYCYANPGE